MNGGPELMKGEDRPRALPPAICDGRRGHFLNAASVVGGFAEVHGPRLAQLDAMAADYSNVEGYAAAVRKGLQEASGLSADAFSKLLEPAERAADSQFAAPSYPPKPDDRRSPDVMFRRDFEALSPADRADVMKGDDRPTIVDFDFNAAWDAGMAAVLGEKKEVMQ